MNASLKAVSKKALAVMEDQFITMVKDAHRHLDTLNVPLEERNDMESSLRSFI